MELRARFSAQLLGAAASQLALPKKFLIFSFHFFIMIFHFIWGHKWCYLINVYDKPSTLVSFQQSVRLSLYREAVPFIRSPETMLKNRPPFRHESFIRTEIASLTALEEPGDQSTASLPTTQVPWKSYHKPAPEKKKWEESIFKWRTNVIYILFLMTSGHFAVQSLSLLTGETSKTFLPGMLFC